MAAVVADVKEAMPLAEFAVQEIAKTEVPEGVPRDEEGRVLPQHRSKQAADVSFVGVFSNARMRAACVSVSSRSRVVSVR